MFECENLSYSCEVRGFQIKLYRNLNQVSSKVNYILKILTKMIKIQKVSTMNINSINIVWLLIDRYFSWNFRRNWYNYAAYCVTCLTKLIECHLFIDSANINSTFSHRVPCHSFILLIIKKYCKNIYYVVTKI